MDIKRRNMTNICCTRHYAFRLQPWLCACHMRHMAVTPDRMPIRIGLERLRPEHASEMFTGLSAPEAYELLPDDPPKCEGTLRKKYEHQARGKSPDGTEIWLNWIIRDQNSGEVMGYTQATVTTRPALLGYHIFPCFWRSGVGSRALSATLDLIFGEAGIDRAYALVDTRNAGSIALLRKLGFALVRQHQDADFFKGKSSDEFEFELACEAWNGC